MSENRKFDSFDEFAEDYRDIHTKNIEITGGDSSYFAEHKIKEIKKKESLDGINFLDFGCGDGIISDFFNNYFPSSEYTGVDISSDSILQAKNIRSSSSNFLIFDGLNLPFKDDTFDVVFVACVFHHIQFEMHQAIMTEILRVLKKGGRLYVFEHNPYNPITRRIVNTCPFDKDAILLKPSYLKTTLLNVGFNEVRIQYVLFFPRHALFNFLICLEDRLQKIPIGGQYFSLSIK